MGISNTCGELVNEDHPILIWLVVFRHLPLGKMMECSSVGMMKFPTEWEVIKFHGSSHHQPEKWPKFRPYH